MSESFIYPGTAVTRTLIDIFKVTVFLQMWQGYVCTVIYKTTTVSHQVNNKRPSCIYIFETWWCPSVNVQGNNSQTPIFEYESNREDFNHKHRTHGNEYTKIDIKCSCMMAGHNWKLQIAFDQNVKLELTMETNEHCYWLECLYWFSQRTDHDDICLKSFFEVCKLTYMCYFSMGNGGRIEMCLINIYILAMCVHRWISRL